LLDNDDDDAVARVTQVFQGLRVLLDHLVPLVDLKKKYVVVLKVNLVSEEW